MTRQAEDCWQALSAGIDLLNLLAIYPAPSNAALLEVIESLLPDGPVERALEDLQRLEKSLKLLPDRPGPEVRSELFAELEPGPLQALLQRLSGLHCLYLCKQSGGSTNQILSQLSASPDILHDPKQVRLALVQLHQLKSR